ncbi:hypothetical protein RDWZM_007737 [Blomia tropicalis]|uniref:K Homology domain-containing protein n=1 Tax=Blomia tropicalis TaxID=40697 RepID=A0A9Q0RJP9_BLOTA|nr:hypothetical protein RDWZM_007737 [Blomia tropicalis]
MHSSDKALSGDAELVITCVGQSRYTTTIAAKSSIWPPINPINPSSPIVGTSQGVHSSLSGSGDQNDYDISINTCKESKSKNRSTKLMDSAIIHPPLSQAMRRHLLLNGHTPPYIHDGCAVQVRTKMFTSSGLMSDKLTNRSKLKMPRSSSNNNSSQSFTTHKPTLIAELFASEEEDDAEDDDVEVYPADNVNRQITHYPTNDEEIHLPHLSSADDVHDDVINNCNGHKGKKSKHFNDNLDIVKASCDFNSDNDDVPFNCEAEISATPYDIDDLDPQITDGNLPLDELTSNIAKMHISDNHPPSYLLHKMKEARCKAKKQLKDHQFITNVYNEYVDRVKQTNQENETSIEEIVQKIENMEITVDDLPPRDADRLISYACADKDRIECELKSSEKKSPLLEAAAGGFVDTIRTLIQNGADVNEKNQQNSTPLMLACAGGHLAAVQELFNHGAYMEDQNENGHTPLMEAASGGHVEVARFLVSRGCNINVHSNEYKETALTLAAYKGHFEMVRFLINAGASQGTPRTEELHTALMEASMDGHVEVARLLIDSGANVNMPPDSFESPLTLAACGGHVELALLLLERGANIEEVNDEGYTALMEASREGHEEMVALLISHGAQVNAITEESKETALYMACGTGCIEVFNLLMMAGADIELGSSTPLMEASQEGHIEIVHRLLEAGANVNATNSAGETALTLAAENGHSQVIKLLIDAGAEVDHCAECGKTALMKASQMGHTEAAAFLLSSKAQVNRSSSNNEQTALSLACNGGHSEVVQLLLFAGADIFHRLKDNSTMLIEAVKGGHTDVVQILINYQGTKASSFGQSSMFMDKPRLPPTVRNSKSNKLMEQGNVQMTPSMPPVLPLNGVVQKDVASSLPPKLSSNNKVNNNDGSALKCNPRQGKKTVVTTNFKRVRRIIRMSPNRKCSQMDIKKLSQFCIPAEEGVVTDGKKNSLGNICNSCSNESLSSDDSLSTNNSTIEPVVVHRDGESNLSAKSLSEQVMEEVSSGHDIKMDSVISEQITAQIFFNIFKHFMSSESTNGNPLDEQILNDLTEEIQCSLLETNHNIWPWLENGLEMVEQFKQFPSCDKFIADLSSLSAKQLNAYKTAFHLNTLMLPTDEYDIIIPGLVLEKILKNEKMRQKLLSTCNNVQKQNTVCESINSTTMDEHNEPTTNSMVKEMACQTDPNDLVEGDREDGDGEEEDEDDDGVYEYDDDDLPDTNIMPQFLDTVLDDISKNRWMSCGKLNLEQVIFGIRDGIIVPFKYLDDSLFEVFKNMSLCFVSSNKEKCVQKLLNSIKKLPPQMQLTMLRPLFCVTQSKLQEYGFDVRMFDESFLTGLTGMPNPIESMDEHDINAYEGLPLSNDCVEAEISEPICGGGGGGDDSSLNVYHLEDSSDDEDIFDNGKIQLSLSAEIRKEGKTEKLEHYSIDLNTISRYLTPLQIEHLKNMKKLELTNKSISLFMSSSSQTISTNILHNSIPNDINLESLVVSATSTKPSEKLTTSSADTLEHTTISTSAALEMMSSLFSVIPANPFECEQEKLAHFRDRLLTLAPEAICDLITENVKKNPYFIVTSASQVSKPVTSVSQSSIQNDEHSQPQSAKKVTFADGFVEKDQLEIEKTIGKDSNIPSTTISSNLNNSNGKNGEYCKRIKTSNIDSTTSSKGDNAEATAATVSSNTNTTSTATTAVLTPSLKSEHGAINAPCLTYVATPTEKPLAPHPKSKIASIDLNSQTDSNHDTALTLACAGGHEELVKLLLSRGADIEHREKKGLTPLMLAATNGHAKIVDILFANGADLEAQTDRTKDTALSLACSSGRYEVVEVLLSRSANKEHRNVSDYTPLSLAASGGYVTIINLLLSYGAEINSRTGSKLGISPLMLAAMNGHTDTTRLLLDRGSDINAYIETNRNTALTLACFQGRTEVVGLLLDRNANIEHRAKTGLTPLMEAASGGYVEVGRVLLDKGADVNAPPVPASRDTALTIAADKGHSAFVELLIKRGAMVDVKNKKGYSPLWLACNGGHYDVVQILANSKCDVDSTDNRKFSCMMAAFRRGHVKIVKFLVRHVSQFPSDKEIERCLALCTDEELHKKAILCADILQQAKERQAAEAYKNAANLLEEIDQERTREESRKAAAARRRERRKTKKKEKVAETKADEPSSKCSEHLKDGDELDGKVKSDDGSSKSKKNKNKKKSKDVVSEDDEEDEDTTALTLDDDDFDSIDELVEEYEDLSPVILAETVKTQSSKKKKKKSKKSKELKDNHEVKPIVPAQKIEPSVPVSEMKSFESSQPDNKKAATTNLNNKNNKATKTPVVGTLLVAEKTKVIKEPSETSKMPKNGTQTQTILNNNNKNKQIDDVKSVDISNKNDSAKITSFDYESESYEDYWVEPIPVSKTSNATRIKGNKRSDNYSANERSPNQPSSGPIGKRDEGWKEVVRKSKRVVVPANAISRVIGRAGCNINTIREVSGAHIEVEKQKGQGDRNVIIRGSADATRIASQLIVTLSNEAEKELAEIIRELGFDKPQIVTTISPSPISTTELQIVASTGTCNAIVESNDSSQGSYFGSSQSTNSASATSSGPGSARTTKNTNKSSNKSVPVSCATSTIIGSTNLVRNSKSSNSSITESTWSSNSINKSTSSPCQSASSTSNTVSYTMAVNSKTRNTTFSNSSGKPTNTVKIMSAVFKPSNKQTSYGSNRVHHSTSAKSAEYSDIYNKGQLSPGAPTANRNITNDNNESLSSKSNDYSVSATLSSENTADYTPFNSIYSSTWSKPLDKPNIGGQNNANVLPPVSNASSTGGHGQNNKPVEISVDESKAVGFNRQFISPGSFSTSSSSSLSSSSTIPPNISAATSNNSSVPPHILGPIGSVRSAPCTPPISNVNVTYNNRLNKFPGAANQPTVSDNFNANIQLSDSIASLGSKLADTYLSTNDPTIKMNEYAHPFNQTSSSNVFGPNGVNTDDNGKYSNPTSNQMFNRPGNFLEMTSNPAEQIAKPSVRSSTLNPNAPDFSSRSNSFSTNTLPHQSLMNHANSTNSLNGSNSSISSTGFNNLSNMVPPNRAHLPTPPISNTAVRAAIVNYSMNLFQNQVPKQHQEAAARLAHLSAQNSNFVNTDFQNVFVTNGQSNIGTNSLVNANANTNGYIHPQTTMVPNPVTERLRMVQYMKYNQSPFVSMTSSNSPNNIIFSQLAPGSSFNSNFGHGSQNLSAARNSTSSSINTSTFSGTTFANTNDPINLMNASSANMYTMPNSSMELNDDHTQRSKQPAPIGTERAQRKNPLHGFGTSNQPVVNPLQSNSNTLFPDLSWNSETTNELMFPATNPGLNTFNSDYSDIFLNETNTLPSLPELDSINNFPMLNRQPIQQQKFNSGGMIDGLGSFETSNQMNSYKGMNQTNNPLFPTPSPFSNNGNNMDSDYWSSSSSSSITKQTPNCSTSGINSAFENKINWNNWN